MRQFVIGLDPGVTGGYAILNRRAPQGIRFGLFPLVEVEKPNKRRPGGKAAKNPTRIERFYDLPRLCDILRTVNPEWVHVFIEQVNSRPGEGGVQGFKFGDCYGQLKGAAAALQMPFEVIHPKVWSAAMVPHTSFLPKNKKDNIAEAKRLLSQWGVDSWSYTKLRDGEADAILLAAYGAKLCTARETAHETMKGK